MRINKNLIEKATSLDLAMNMGIVGLLIPKVNIYGPPNEVHTSRYSLEKIVEQRATKNKV